MKQQSNNQSQKKLMQNRRNPDMGNQNGKFLFQFKQTICKRSPNSNWNKQWGSQAPKNEMNQTQTEFGLENKENNKYGTVSQE